MDIAIVNKLNAEINELKRKLEDITSDDGDAHFESMYDEGFLEGTINGLEMAISFLKD